MKKILIILAFILFSSSLFAADKKSGRFFEDQPDVNDDYQIHFIYTLAADSKDREWDINGKIEKIADKMNVNIIDFSDKIWKFIYFFFMLTPIKFTNPVIGNFFHVIKVSSIFPTTIIRHFMPRIFFYLVIDVFNNLIWNIYFKWFNHYF